MDFRIKEEMNRLARATDMNARDISDLKLAVCKLISELDAISKKVEHLEQQLCTAS